MWLTSGNMTQDGVYTYTYDAENRLISVAPTTPATGDVKVESVYDYMGRRIRKVVTAWDASLGTGGEWEAVPTSSTHFVYDGWNLILELDGSATGLGGDGLPTYSNAAIRKYTWGLDLSGLSGNPSISGIHGAGGIGGLLAAEQLLNSMAFVYFYDANGNVGQAYNHTLNTLAARYEYDPYGNLVNMTGALFKGKNPFRFSTKYFDKELDLHGTSDGLYYYGYRFYSARLGRWVTRDPIEEEGHVLMRITGEASTVLPPDERVSGEHNVYAYVENSPNLRIDPDGLKSSASVNEKSCTITVSFDIGIYGKKASSALAKKIERCIESHWNGHDTTAGCGAKDPGKCSVVIDAKVTYYSKAKHWWSVKETNQVKFNGKTKRSWVLGVGGTYGRWEDSASCWTFAHEAGHLMGLDDDYSYITGKPHKGHAGHMMGQYGGSVRQHEIDGILGGKTCPKSCCCPPTTQPTTQPSSSTTR